MAGHFLLATYARNEFWVEEADVIGAFLQGSASEESRQVYGSPPPEFAHALGVKPGERLAQVLQSAYGFTVAPRRWWRQVCSDLAKLGWVASELEPCLWRLENPDGPLAFSGMDHSARGRLLDGRGSR